MSCAICNGPMVFASTVPGHMAVHLTPIIREHGEEIMGTTMELRICTGCFLATGALARVYVERGEARLEDVR